MYKKWCLNPRFVPIIYTEVKEVLMREIPNFRMEKINIEATIITSVLIEHEIVVIDELHMDQNRVAVGLFTYFYHMNWKELDEGYGRRKSLDRFITQVLSDYHNAAQKLFNPQLARELKQRQPQRKLLSVPPRSEKPKIA